MIKLLGIGLAAAVLYALQQMLYRRFWDKNLSVELRFTDSEIFEGESSALQEIIINAKYLPLNMLKVKFQTDRNLIFDSERGSRTTDQFYRNDVFQINGGERIIRTLPFTGGKRGYYSIRNIDLVGTDLFLSSRMYASWHTDERIYVLPKPFMNREFRRSLQQLNGEILTRRHLLEDPFEYRGIREYQPSDDMRSINWKATAKTGDLKVNQRNYTALKAVRVFLNIEDDGVLKKEECVEASLRIGAGLCRFFAEQGMRIACYCNGVDCLTGRYMEIPPSAGAAQLKTIYRSLARIDTGKPVADFGEVFGEKLLTEAEGTVTCLVSPNQYPDFVSLLEQYQATGRDFIWYYPLSEFQTPEFPAALRKNVRVLSAR